MLSSNEAVGPCFAAYVDVQQFAPEDLSAKLTEDDQVVVEGKHTDREDKHGFVSRHFIRRYIIPHDCDVRKVQCQLSADGVLSVTAPKKTPIARNEGLDIPIVMTGPFHVIEN